MFLAAILALMFWPQPAEDVTLELVGVSLPSGLGSLWYVVVRRPDFEPTVFVLCLVNHYPLSFPTRSRQGR